MNEAFHTSLHTAMKARAAEILPEVIELRRTIHKHPETGFDTGETEKLVKTFLEREHIAILPSELGVLGLIRGQNRDRIVALRADMDARSRCRKRPVSPTALRSPAKCTPAGTTGTPPCCSARQRSSRNTRTSSRRTSC